MLGTVLVLGLDSGITVWMTVWVTVWVTVLTLFCRGLVWDWVTVTASEKWQLIAISSAGTPRASDCGAIG